MFEVKITVDESVDVVAFFRSLSIDAIIKSWENVRDEIMITLWFMDKLHTIVPESVLRLLKYDNPPCNWYFAQEWHQNYN